MRLGPGITVVAGRNGAGKSNLLEALYFACTGRSCRTSNEKECVRFGAGVLRLEMAVTDPDAGVHKLCTGFQPGESKRFTVDGAPVERLADASVRPLVSVFLPDRLELIAGTPSLRRAHLDQVVTALWPARAGTRRSYAAALAQRNALVVLHPRRPRRPGLPARLGRRAGPSRHRPDGGPRDDDRAPAAPLRRARGGARSGRGRAAHLQAAVEGDHAGGARRGAGRARRRGPPAGVHRPRAAPGRHRLHARGARPARVRLPRAAAPGPPRRCCWPSARSWPRSGARRR